MAKNMKRAITSFIDASGNVRFVDPDIEARLKILHHHHNQESYRRYHQIILSHVSNDRIAAIESNNQIAAVEERFRNYVSPPATPSSAILSALLPFSMSEDVIENLNELFEESWLPRHGLRTARRIWRVQASLIVARHWLSPLLSLLDRIKQLKTGG
jgi:hypothetical protein